MKALLALLLVLTSCDSGSMYVYTVGLYNPQLDCIIDFEGIDVIEGNDPGSTCTPKCIVGQDVDGDTLVSATTECGPPPYGFDVSGSNPLCPNAMAALTRSDYCLDGGGSSNPLDAGTQ